MHAKIQDNMSHSHPHVICTAIVGDQSLTDSTNCLLRLQGGAIVLSHVGRGTYINCDFTFNSAKNVSLRKQGGNFETTEPSVTSTTVHIIVK